MPNIQTIKQIERLYNLVKRKRKKQKKKAIKIILESKIIMPKIKIQNLKLNFIGIVLVVDFFYMKS